MHVAHNVLNVPNVPVDRDVRDVRVYRDPKVSNVPYKVRSCPKKDQGFDANNVPKSNGLIVLFTSPEAILSQSKLI